MNSPKGLEYRKKLLNAIRHKQFEISYYSNTSLIETEEFFPFELDAYFDILVKRKKDEFEAKKQALDKSKSKTSPQKNKPSHQKR